MVRTHLSLIGIMGRKRTITAKEEAVSVLRKVLYDFTVPATARTFTAPATATTFTAPASTLGFTSSDDENTGGE